MRLPLVLVALGLILYHTIYLVAFVPMGDVDFGWRLVDSALIVTNVPADSPAAPSLQPDDILLTIDGRPVTWTIWQPLYMPRQPAYTYTVQREAQVLSYVIPVDPVSFSLVVERLTSGSVALLVWLVAAVVLLLATPQNEDAWLLGLTTLGVAVVLAASEAALYGVPGAWLSSFPFLPVVAVSLAHLALLPRREPRTLRAERPFHLLYAGALLLGIFAVIELVVWNPRGLSLGTLTGISLYELLYLCLIVGGVAHLVILGWRFWRMPPSYQRRQLAIVLTFTAVALLPGVFLTIIPRLLLDAPLLPWDLSIALLTLIPAGYAYVIYRRNYLGLDVFATRSLTYLLVALLLLTAHTSITYLLRQRPALAALEPLPGALLLLPVFMAVPGSAARIRSTLEAIVYGAEPASSSGHLQAITAALAADPHPSTLGKVMRDVAAQLQVRQMALLLAEPTGRLVCIDQARLDEPVAVLTTAALAPFGLDVTVRRWTDEEGHPLLARHNWIAAVAPVTLGDVIIGILCFGPPVPDGYLNARQIAYVGQVADVMAVAAEAMRLFDASRAMSRELLRVRDVERMQLAGQIHDGPLQSVSLAAGRLNRLAEQAAAVASTTAAQLAAAELSTLSHEMQYTSRQLRDICAGLHPPLLKQGAQWAVKEVVYHFRDKTRWDVHLDVRVGPEVHIPQTATVTVYYILNEALHNVYKHAQATAVWVSLSCEEGRLSLVVADNGCHADRATWSLPALVRASHFGIVGMHEWARLAGGALRITRREGEGTAVTLHIPFTPRDPLA
jgi:signal transduction histidine kinase